MKKQIRSYTPCVFYTFATVCFMLCNAHGTISSENTDNLFDTQRTIANGEKEEPGLTPMEKIAAISATAATAGATATVSGVALTHSDKIKNMLGWGSDAKTLATADVTGDGAKALSRGKAAPILGAAVLVGAGAAGAARIARKTRDKKACAAHIIDQLRRHNFVGTLLWDKVDGEPGSHGIQCNYYKTISDDKTVDNKVLNWYKYLPDPSVPENVSLFRQYCTESNKGQCDTSQTVCLINQPKTC
jgi:hypothetical protein